MGGPFWVKVQVRCEAFSTFASMGVGLAVCTPGVAKLPVAMDKAQVDCALLQWCIRGRVHPVTEQRGAMGAKGHQGRRQKGEGGRQ